MNRTPELHDDGLIDLGKASIETKGPPMGEIEDVLGQFPSAGLLDD